MSDVQDRNLRDHLIRCLDCCRSDTVTWLPLLWNAGPCLECARSSVAKHLTDFPTHRCTVTGNEESA